MQKQQKLEIAARIKQLRERSPYKQEAIAQKLGLKLRSYQKLEAVGTEDFERCEELYEIHKEWVCNDPEWSFVSAGWIWDGRSRKGDLMGSLSEAEARSLKRLEDQIDLLRAELAKGFDGVHSDLESLRKSQAPGRRSRKGTGT